LVRSRVRFTPKINIKSFSLYFSVEVTRHIHDEGSWFMLFADDLSLVDETRERIYFKLNRPRETLKPNGF